MRAGKLNRLIVVERSIRRPNDLGTIERIWFHHRTLRAELVEQSTEEFLAGGGEVDRRVTVFRVRKADDIATTDRVRFRGQAHDIASVVEIEGGRGLELRCATKGSMEP